MTDINVSGVKLTAKQVTSLEALIPEIRGFGTGWRVLDEIALAVHDALPAGALEETDEA